MVAGLGNDENERSKNERWLPAKNLRGDALVVSLRENLKEDERRRGRGGMACLGMLDEGVRSHQKGKKINKSWKLVAINHCDHKKTATSENSLKKHTLQRKYSHFSVKQSTNALLIAT